MLVRFKIKETDRSCSPPILSASNRLSDAIWSSAFFLPHEFPYMIWAKELSHDTFEFEWEIPSYELSDLLAEKIKFPQLISCEAKPTPAETSDDEADPTPAETPDDEATPTPEKSFIASVGRTIEAFVDYEYDEHGEIIDHKS